MARALVNVVLYVDRFVYVRSSNQQLESNGYVFLHVFFVSGKEKEGIDQFYERKLNFPASVFISRFSFIWAASNVSPVQVNPVLTCLGIEKGNYARSLVTPHCCESLYV